MLNKILNSDVGETMQPTLKMELAQDPNFDLKQKLKKALEYQVSEQSHFASEYYKLEQKNLSFANKIKEQMQEDLKESTQLESIEPIM